MEFIFHSHKNNDLLTNEKIKELKPNDLFYIITSFQDNTWVKYKIKTLDGDILLATTYMKEEVYNIKRILKFLYNKKPESFRLIWAGIQLSDEGRCCDSNVYRDSREISLTFLDKK